MRTPRRSIFPLTFQAALSLVAALSDQAFSVLVDQVRGPEGFETGRRRCSALSERMGVDADSVRVIVQAVGYMYEQIHGGDPLDPDEVRDVVSSDVEVEEGVDGALLHARLQELLAHDQGIEGYRSERDLKAGFLERATGFSTVLDLRPEVRVGGDGPKLVPLVQLRIHVAGAGDGSDPVVLQLDVRALDELEAAMRDVRERLASLRRDPRFGRAIVD